MKARNSWQVTLAVWHAIFMRETIVRVAGERLSWFWMLFEPVALIIIMVGVRAIVGAHISFNGVEQVPWLVVGLLGFFLFRENLMRSLGAIDSNRALFAYRQVKPIDPVLVRFYVEGVLKTFVLLLFILGSLLQGLDLLPDKPMLAMFLWFSLWMLGVGAGLVVSALSTIIQEIGWITRILSFPLLLISGAIFPISHLPDNFRQLLMINPIAHGLELLRGAFFDSYRVIPEADVVYMWFWILGWVLMGLMLHIRYKYRLAAS
ncbi:MAG: ABC transporter permease [Gammaproteobacteria bacterium]